MGQIKILESEIANKIAAGEVVERPASVIKELVENSIDAQSTAIAVEINEGGISYIRVADDGTGMEEADAVTSFIRHATSKLSGADDLFSIATLGFRGEALASVAAVAHVTLKTRTETAQYGTQVKVNGGSIESITPCGCPNGTTIEVADLFYNVPARLKFLKAARTEASYISDYMSRLILARPDISFKLISSGKVVYQSRGDANLSNAIYCIHGVEVLPYLRQVEYYDGYVTVNGYIGTEQISRSSRSSQSIFINGRYIRSRKLSDAISDAFETRLMSGRFPFAVISIGVGYSEVDVNVHPNKMEVRFKDEHHICDALTQAVKRALGNSAAPGMFVDNPTQNEYKVHGSLEDKPMQFHVNVTSFEQDKPQDIPNIPDFSPIVRSQAVSKTELPESTDDSVPIISAPKVMTAEYEAVQADFGLTPFTIIGCAFDSFWFVQQDENVFIIDQHAAHERILYEGAMKHTLIADSQMLLVPMIVKLAAPEYELYMQNAEIFHELGFVIDEFGTLTLRISSVPHVFESAQDERFFRDALTMLAKNRSLTLKEAKRDAIISASCKSAVKLGMSLPREVIEELIQAYSNDDVPLTCPHGRPVMIVVSKNSLFKMFKRIV